MASDPSSNADLPETPDRESKMTTREKLLAATGSHIVNKTQDSSKGSLRVKMQQKRE